MVGKESIKCGTDTVLWNLVAELSKLFYLKVMISNASINFKIFFVFLVFIYNLVKLLQSFFNMITFTTYHNIAITGASRKLFRKTPLSSQTCNYIF